MLQHWNTCWRLTNRYLWSSWSTLCIPTDWSLDDTWAWDLGVCSHKSWRIGQPWHMTIIIHLKLTWGDHSLGALHLSRAIQVADGSLSHKRLTETISLVCTHSVRTGTSADCSFSWAKWARVLISYYYIIRFCLTFLSKWFA